MSDWYDDLEDLYEAMAIETEQEANQRYEDEMATATYLDEQERNEETP